MCYRIMLFTKCSVLSTFGPPFQVSFNPITANSIKKTLLRICRQEQRDLPIEQIDMLAKASRGDIRHAITSLQLICMKPDGMLNLSQSSISTSTKEMDEIGAFNNGYSMQIGRDETLSLFHALGKFLHNKRETEGVIRKGMSLGLTLKIDKKGSCNSLLELTICVSVFL